MIIKVPLRLQYQTCYAPPTTIQLSSKTQIPSNIPLNKELQRLVKSYLPICKKKYYPQKFVRIFLLIKINSIALKQCQINEIIIQQLKQVYNCAKLDDIQISNTQSEILCQILIKILNIHLNEQQFHNIIQGNGLLAASALWLAQLGERYLQKQEIAFCLSLSALNGSIVPFTPIVHRQKSHKGQIHFALRVTQLMQTKQNNKRSTKVQDPYSIRCGPQVHGVAYDCLTELKNGLNIIINKPHCKQIVIGNKKIINLLCQSDTFSLKMDFFICSLQEIGAMAFMRMERILNSYLGSNKLKQKQQYASLCSMMHSALSAISRNKILSEMTNFDNCCIDNYKKDIFYGSGLYYDKINELMDNLYYIMALEIMAALEGIKELSQKNEEIVEFANKQMNDNYGYLSKVTSPYNKTESYLAIKELWMKEMSIK